jgi:hypothetical protein
MKSEIQVGCDFNGTKILEIIRTNRRQSCRCLCLCGKEFFRRQDYLTKKLNENKQLSCGCTDTYKRGKQHCFWAGHEDISGGYFSSIKCKARNKNIPFDITIEQAWELFLKQDKKCALTNFPLTFSESRHVEAEKQTASLDRIDSSKGYIVGNIQWIHKQINYMKHMMSQETFINWCQLVVNHTSQSIIRLF